MDSTRESQYHGAGAPHTAKGWLSPRMSLLPPPCPSSRRSVSWPLQPLAICGENCLRSLGASFSTGSYSWHELIIDGCIGQESIDYKFLRLELRPLAIPFLHALGWNEWTEPDWVLGDLKLWAGIPCRLSGKLTSRNGGLKWEANTRGR